MSLHINALLVRGLPTDRIDELLSRFGYRLEAERQRFDSMQQLPPRWEIAMVATGGWLVLLESDYSFHSDLEACRQAAADYATAIFGMSCEGVSRTYAFTYADSSRARQFERVGSQIVVDSGAPLEEELKKPQSEADILQLMATIAFPYHEIEKARAFTVLTVNDYSDASVRAGKERRSPEGIRKLTGRLFDYENGYALRLVAIRQLVDLRARGSAGDIAKLLRDRDPRIRGEALWALDKLDARQFADEIQNLLGDRKSFDRIAGPLTDSPLKFERVHISEYSSEILKRWGIERRRPTFWSRLLGS